MIGLINYGMGNLASVRRAFEDSGASVRFVSRASEARECARLVLPGVGAFAKGMERLTEAGLVDAIRDHAEQGKPLLGICLGMQMLATYGEESGGSEGLGLIPGRVVRLEHFGCKLRIPHTGWNEVLFKQPSSLFQDIPNGSDFYFVHSYGFQPRESDHCIAETDYGAFVTAAVAREMVFGCQFHPEKSSRAGRRLIANFLKV